jgi:tryptophan synthase alpha chain
MNRIDECFESLKRENKKALVTFITAGDPDYDTSMEVLNSLSAAGADIIELGMPFSDPMADGPVIQESSARALSSGMNLKSVLKMVKSWRATDAKTPLILMGYYNPIYNYGTERFAADASESGVDGLIVVDVPPEESAELLGPLSSVGMHLIRLVTPTTDMDRLDTIMDGSGGFLYYVSITGITGTNSANISEIGPDVKMIRERSDIPVVIGFGIKTPDDALTMSEIADGIVVGSALVNVVKEVQNDNNANIAELISDKVHKLSMATNKGSSKT